MRRFRFDAQTGRAITEYGSDNVIMSPIARPQGHTNIGYFYVAPGGVVGYHQSSSDQLFLVVTGEGWIRGESSERQPIRVGQAAFWDEGEWHESGSETGMTVIIVESDSLELTQFMPEE